MARSWSRAARRTRLPRLESSDDPAKRPGRVGPARCAKRERPKPAHRRRRLAPSLRRSPRPGRQLVDSMTACNNIGNAGQDQLRTRSSLRFLSARHRPGAGDQRPTARTLRYGTRTAECTTDWPPSGSVSDRPVPASRICRGERPAWRRPRSPPRAGHAGSSFVESELLRRGGEEGRGDLALPWRELERHRQPARPDRGRRGTSVHYSRQPNSRHFRQHPGICCASPRGCRRTVISANYPPPRGVRRLQADPRRTLDHVRNCGIFLLGGLGSSSKRGESFPRAGAHPSQCSI